MWEQQNPNRMPEPPEGHRFRVEADSSDVTLYLEVEHTREVRRWQNWWRAETKTYWSWINWKSVTVKNFSEVWAYRNAKAMIEEYEDKIAIKKKIAEINQLYNAGDLR